MDSNEILKMSRIILERARELNMAKSLNVDSSVDSIDLSIIEAYYLGVSDALEVSDDKSLFGRIVH